MSEIKIPDSVVHDIIKAEIIKKLGNQSKLIEDLVQAVLTTKNSRYEEKSIFELRVEKAVLDEAEHIFRDWLANNKEVIKAKLIEKLNSTVDERANELWNTILSKISSSLFDRD